MWSVVIGALVARRGQAGVVGLVALLACTGAATAGWYVAITTQAVPMAVVPAAPIEQRVVSAARTGPPLAADDLVGAFHPLDFQVISGAHVPAELSMDDTRGTDGPPHRVILAYRDGVCDHLAVVGRCPASVGEVLVPAGIADQFGLVEGSRMHLAVAGASPAAVRVTGTYRTVNPFDAYWGDGRLVGVDTGQPPPGVLFTVPAGVGDAVRVVSTHDLVVVPEAFGTVESASLAAAAGAGVAGLNRQGYAVTTDLPVLVERVAAEQRRLATGVVVAVVLLLALTMWTLSAVFRAAADQARGDTAWWQLRGVPTGRGWVAALAPGALPLLVGAVPGTALGAVAGRALAGGHGDVAATGWRWTVLLVVVTVAGALLAAVAVQAGLRRTPLRDLLRRVPVRHRWPRRLLDGVVVMLVAAAVVQLAVAGEEVSGVGLLAPGLVGLALALVAGWAAVPLAAQVAGRALRAGRLRTALTALAIARRPGLSRLFSLAAAAAALAVVALTQADTAARHHRQLAAMELGAPQVWTVAPVDAGRLLAAVRAADPDGEEAMAVVHTRGRAGAPEVLAVDSTRLPAVAAWQDSFGPTAVSVAAMLRPDAPPPVMVTADRLDVEVAGVDPGGHEVSVRVLLRTAGTGEPADVVIGPLSPQGTTHSVQVPACATGCRLAGFELLGTSLGGGYAVPGDGSRVDLYRLADAVPLADAGRWRPAVGEWHHGPAIDVDGGRLRLTRAGSTAPPPNELPLLRRDDRVFAVDAPVPLPVVAAGWRPQVQAIADPRMPVLGGPPVPVEPQRTAARLPVVGGDGVLVDLEYAHRVDLADGAGSTAQVWLAATAGEAVVERLRAAGLDPVRRQAVDEHAAGLAAADGAAAAMRFQVAAALLVLALAAGAMLARFAGQQPDVGSEWAALRTQGIADRVGRAVAYAVPLAVAGAAVTAGTVAGVLGAALARTAYPGVGGGLTSLPVPPLHPYPVVVAALVSTVVLGTAAVLAGSRAGRYGGTHPERPA
jgi:putative ABC transport system permease protein